MEAPVKEILEALCDRLEAIEERLQQIQRDQARRDSLMDHLHNKLIALQASFDHKVGLWEEEQVS